MSGVCDRLESATRCLSDMSYIDGLTGLLTRDHFRAALDLEIERALRYESEFSLCLLDLDNFQAVNQTYGHAAGDFVLSEVGAFFREHMRKSDASCRYSGQQFAFFLVNSAGEKGRNACERLRKRLADHVFTDNGTPLHVTASIGMVSMNPRVAESGEELLDLVSRALRRAKQEGKNRVEVYD
jgi:diguanylate cyclase (GGDEF)-like protein